jgi:hypothetical protein
MQETIKELQDIARRIRIDIVTMIHKAGDKSKRTSLERALVVPDLCGEFAGIEAWFCYRRV